MTAARAWSDRCSRGPLLAPPAAAATVDAGSLRAEVGRGSWSLRLTDSGGRPILSQAPGTLGFRTAAGWFRATRVLDSRRRHGVWEGTLATTDPGGLRERRAGTGDLHLERHDAARVGLEPDGEPAPTRLVVASVPSQTP